MAEAIHATDLRKLLTVIDAARSSEADDGLPAGVLEHARDLVACDIISFTEFDPAHQRDYLNQNPPGDATASDPAAFWHHYWHCAPCCYPDRSGDLLTVTTISDFYTRRQWHNTGMYTDYLGPCGVEAEAMICLAAPTGHARRLLFFRGPGPDFDGRATRQWELLHLLASGQSNADIARELVVSVSTVRKHLENIFARLGVTNRTAAIAKAFPGPPY